MQTLQTSIDEAVEHRAVGDIGRYSRMADNFPRLWSNVEQVYQILRIEADDSLGTDAYRFQHIKSRTGSRVYTGGDRCDAIFIVYAGFLKTSWIDKYGNEKIPDFPMKGDLIGFDGIESKTFKNTLVALSDIELIVVPLEFFSGTGGKAHGFRRRLMELMSQADQWSKSWLYDGHATGRSARCEIPAIDLAKISGDGLLGQVISFTHDARRHWQLSWAHAGNGEPHAVRLRPRRVYPCRSEIH